MTAQLWKTSTQNAFATTLNGNIIAGDSTITLTSVSGLQYPGILVIDRLDINNTPTPNLREYISYTGITGSQITGVTRGLNNTTDQAHNSGSKVEEVFTTAHWTDLLAFLLVSHDALGNILPEALSLSYAADGGSTDSYAITLTPAPATYVAGQVFYFKANTVNTGAATLDVNALGAKTIKKNFNSDLDNGDIVAGQLVSVIYDGTNFQLLSPVAGGVSGSSTTTFTNKRIEPRIVTAASYTTDTGTSLSVATADIFQVTAQAGALLFNSPGGTPVAGQKLIIRIKDDGTARALTWNSVFRAMGTALPSTTVLSKTLYLGFIYNFTDTKWDLVASAQEA